MGVGIVLAVGGRLARVIHQSPMVSEGTDRRIKTWRHLTFILYVFMVALMGLGVLCSYSRGAWVAVTFGLSYLLAKSECRMQNAKVGYKNLYSSVTSQFFNWGRRNWLSVCALILSLTILAFWHFGYLERVTIAGRVFSTVNVSDFSWRNRAVAWEGALQSMAQHPWMGTGWNQSEPLYQSYYLTPKINESGAIEMNDYLMLGTTLGIPALLCFGMYIWLCLADKGWRSEIRGVKLEVEKLEIKSRKSEIELNWLQTACRSGAIVLAVGFWFDGGLFKLATASTFWILLELGREDL